MDNDPPEVLIAKSNIILISRSTYVICREHCDNNVIFIFTDNKMLSDRKKQTGSKLSSKSLNSPVPSDSSISIGEDSNCSGELFRNKVSSIYSHAYVQPTETLSDLLLEEDEPNGT